MIILENEFLYSNLLSSVKEIIKQYFYVNVNGEENKEELVVALKKYIERHYRYPFSNRILEEKFGYSAFYLRSIFKCQQGISPSAYLLQIRIKKACELLEKHIQAKEVAQEVGYTDPLYFSKVFKKQTGYSPSEYVARKKVHV